jgi:hypothetical protein
MRSCSSLVTVLPIAAVALACADNRTTAPTAARTPVPVWAPGAALVVSPSTMLMMQGDTVALDAVLVQPNGLRQAVAAEWTPSNAQVIATISGPARVVAIAPGTATLLAAFDTLRAEASVTIVDKQFGKLSSATGDALILDRFFMIEYQYPSEPGQWYYAPQIRAGAAPGRTARITKLTFSIPGLDGWTPPLDCNAQLVTTTLTELNGDAYGDWLFDVFEGGHKATAANAEALVTFIDDSGRTATRAIEGPVVRGGLPWSTSGVADSGACFPPS